MSPSRFDGGCEPLVKVNVADLVEWVSQIKSATWPDWGKGPNRPAVVVDPVWEGLGEVTQPLVRELLMFFPGCSDTYRAITTVHAGDYVPHHTDTLCPGWVSRIHVPLITNPGAIFFAEQVEHHMAVGMSYQVNPSRPHAIANRGDATRVHLMFDVIES